MNNNWQQQLLKIMEQRGTVYNNEPVVICTVKSLQPFIIDYKGLEVGFTYGDTIFMDNRRLDSNINQDVASLDNPQTLDPQAWIADNTPHSDFTITGTQKQFLIDFYKFYKDYQKRFIIDIGDLVVVQKLQSNTYYIIEKVQKIEQ